MAALDRHRDSLVVSLRRARARLLGERFLGLRLALIGRLAQPDLGLLGAVGGVGAALLEQHAEAVLGFGVASSAVYASPNIGLNQALCGRLTPAAV